MTPEEYFGGSSFITVGADTILHAGVRAWTINATASVNAFLPNATQYKSTGAQMLYILNASAVNTVTLKDADSNTIETLGPFNSTWVANSDISTPVGAYKAHHKIASFGLGSFIPIGRELFTVRFTEDENNVDLPLKLATEFNYTFANPARVHVIIESGAVIGSTSPTLRAFDTGFQEQQIFPNGSIVVIDIRRGSAILGKGGDGGIAGDWAAPFGQRGGTPPVAGGAALGLFSDTLLINDGVIAGGGGGGGAGGFAFDVENGGGGGGGAGELPGIGGEGGNRGVDGQRTIAGGGGVSTSGLAGNGGTGGLLGQPGEDGEAGGSQPPLIDQNGQTGGAAGNWIEFLTGVTVTSFSANGLFLGGGAAL
jgi:hypothetical protein